MAPDNGARGLRGILPRGGQTVAWRLTLFFLLLSSFPLAVMAIFVRHTVSMSFADLIARDTRIEARLVAESLAALPDAAVPRVLETAVIEHRAVTVLAADGSVVASAGAGATEALPAGLPARTGQAPAGTWIDETSGRVFGYAPVPRRGGMVIVVAEPTEVTGPLGALERASLVQLGVSLALISLAGGLAIWIIIGPIRHLTAAAEQIGAGKMDVVVDAEEMEGELAVLTRAFNQMAWQLRSSYSLLAQQVADRTRELDTLNQIASAIGRSLALDATLANTLRTVLEQLGYAAGAICLRQPSGDEIVLAHCEGFPGDLCAMAPWRPVAERVIAAGRPLVQSRAGHEPALLPVAAEAGFDVMVCVPLTARERIEGVLIVAATARAAIPDKEAELLVSIGHQIGVGVQNSRLHAQSQQLAVLEERQRLARDLHDSVTQQLYGISLYTDAATRSLAAGDAARGDDHLRQACQTAQDALRQMRLLIFELRPHELAEGGLSQALRTRLEQVEGRAGIEAVLDADPDILLAPDLEEQLYRVAGEALNNALKHARAHRLRVTLRQPGGPGSVLLEVVDDGVGMDPDTAQRHGGMGLNTMRERVRQLGGHLSIQSAPGAGTTVRVAVPGTAEG